MKTERRDNTRKEQEKIGKWLQNNTSALTKEQKQEYADMENNGLILPKEITLHINSF